MVLEMLCCWVGENESRGIANVTTTSAVFLGWDGWLWISEDSLPGVDSPFYLYKEHTTTSQVGTVELPRLSKR